MRAKRHAVKGEPDFHTLSDERLSVFLEVTQQMIFAYTDLDAGKVKVLEEIWKDLSNESTDRLVQQSVVVEKHEEDSGAPASLLRKVPKVRKSPVKRKI